MERVAIIVPNYKGGQMLRATIKRLVETQPADSFKLYLIDNGSMASPDDCQFLFGEGPDDLHGLFKVKPNIQPGNRVDLCWDSIYETTPPDTTSGQEQIENVVRNKTVQVVCQSLHENLALIQLDKNHGFETAVNLGFLASGDVWDYDCNNGGMRSGPNVILMGSDVWMSPGCIEGLDKVAKLHPRIGLVGPKLWKKIGTSRFVVGGGYCSGKPLHYRGWDMDEGPWHHFQNCPWVTFSVVYIKREVIAEVGFLDMSFSIYGGDSEWARRARQKNWAAIYAPNADAGHGESITVGLVRREIGDEEFHRRQRAEQRYYALKWRNKHVGMVELPPDVFAEAEKWPRP